MALPPGAGGELKDRLLAEIRRAKKFFYGTVVAQAQKIEIAGDRVTFTFAPAHRALRAQLEQGRSWVEPLATRVAGRKMTVVGVEGPGSAAPAANASPAAGSGADPATTPAPTPESELRDRALGNESVQAMLDVFAAEITKVEEI